MEQLYQAGEADNQAGCVQLIEMVKDRHPQAQTQGMVNASHYLKRKINAEVSGAALDVPEF